MTLRGTFFFGAGEGLGFGDGLGDGAAMGAGLGGGGASEGDGDGCGLGEGSAACGRDTTPESTTAPVRLSAAKWKSSPAISASMNT